MQGGKIGGLASENCHVEALACSYRLNGRTLGPTRWRWVRRQGSGEQQPQPSPFSGAPTQLPCPQVGADAVSHGATGKGNDQVRFEVG